MGLIREIQDIKHDLTKSQRAKLEKELLQQREKELEKEYKQTLNEVLKAKMYTTLNKYNDSYLKIIDDMYTILDDATEYILNLKKTIIKEVSYQVGDEIETKEVKEKIQRFEFDYNKIYNDLYDIFYNVLNEIKKPNDLKNKFSNEEVQKLLINKLEDCYSAVNRRFPNDMKANYEILKKIEIRNSIIKEINGENNIDEFIIDKNYNKALAFIKNKYNYGIQNDNARSQEQSLRLPLGLKIITFTKIWKSIWK